MNIHIDTEKYPIRVGEVYMNEHMMQTTLLVADIPNDKFILKDADSPWTFESNYSTFAFYWKLYEKTV